MRYMMVYTIVARTMIPVASGTDVAGEGIIEAILDLSEVTGWVRG